MKQNIIFVFALLVMLAMVNAVPYKRTTHFGACPVSPPIPVLDVSISPDPPVAGQTDTFTISGSGITVPDGYNVAIVFLDPTTKQPIPPVFIADAPAGPLGTITEKVPVPTQLPATYAIGVAIADISANPPVAVGCALAVVGGTPPLDFTLDFF